MWHARTITSPLRSPLPIGLLLIGLVAASCSGSSSRENRGSSSGTHMCTLSQLHLSLGPDISAATGQNPSAIRLTNRGHSCSLYGYPRIQLTDASAKLIPFRVADSGDQTVTSKPPAQVRVPSRGDAWVVLNKYRCDLGDRRQVRTLRVALPGGSGTATLSFPGHHDWSYCGAGDPGSTIHVSPFEAALVAALTHT